MIHPITETRLLQDPVSAGASPNNVPRDMLIWMQVRTVGMHPLQGFLEASPDAVLVVDEGGVIQRANRKVTAVLGYEPEALLGTAVEGLLREADREDHVRFRRDYVADPEPRPMGRELDLYALHRDGSEVPVEISLGPIELDGELSVVATITDVTKRKERERQLQRQNERLEDFASIVSHDLRNPLRTAEGNLELLRQETDSEYVAPLERSLARMDALVGDLLALAREGEAVQAVEQVALAEVVRESWATVDTADATLAVESHRRIDADPGRLRQFLENLFRNAVEHGGPAVTVTVGDHDGGFFVADDGPGIPGEDRSRVFEAGYSTAPEGTGFGLQIVDAVAAAHDWEVAVSEASGGGARFEVTGVRRSGG
mgnify:CR=1 FL=1